MILEMSFVNYKNCFFYFLIASVTDSSHIRKEFH